VTNEVIRIIFKDQLSVPKKILNRCLDNGLFPKAWKKARLVLLRKGDDPGLSNNQYEFRKGHSTTNAISYIVLFGEDELGQEESWYVKIRYPKRIHHCPMGQHH